MLITKFYETYLDENNADVNPNKELLFDFLNNKLDEEQMMQVESFVTELEDSEAERAFIAGFKKAFELLVEVMA